MTTRHILIAVLLILGSQSALGHGGVVEEDDVCVIRINYLKGHFKVYQPRTDGHREYCEDLPAATESVFVMEYLHEGLAEVPVDFRIIRDVTGKGRFARWEDIAAIDDLDAVTVFYRAPVTEPDVLTVVHDFDAEGDYIGIVTADVGDTDRVYRAVFPFEVGYTGLGYWPLIIGLLVAAQLSYFVMGGRLRRRPGAVTVAVLLLAALPVMADDAPIVEYESSVNPVPVNAMHSWILVVTTPDGEPLTGADITVEGGMPAHDHGLPTRPRVTAELGDGRYRLDGLRFHMPGEWQINVMIVVEDRRWTVTIPLQL